MLLSGDEWIEEKDLDPGQVANFLRDQLFSPFLSIVSHLT